MGGEDDIDPVSATQDPSIATQTPSVVIQNKEAFVAEVQSIVAKQVFNVSFSMWSPDGIPTTPETDDNNQGRLSRIQDAVLTSIRSLYCRDKVDEFCVVRDDLLLTNKETFVAPKQVNDSSEFIQNNPGPTLLVASVADVSPGSAGYPVPWTTWRVSIQIMQLGSLYISEIIDSLDEPGLTATEVNDLASRLLEGKVVSDMKRIIEEGSFDGLLHSALDMDTIVTSMIGSEKAVFLPLMSLASAVSPDSSTSTTPSTVETSSGGGSSGSGDSNMVLIYAGLGAIAGVLACFVLVFCYYRHSKKKGSQRQSITKVQEAAPSPPENEDMDNTSTCSSPAVPTDAEAGAIDVEASEKGQTEAMAEDMSKGDMSDGLASWQYKPRRFVLQSEASQSEAGDEASAFKTGGSIVAGSAPVGSLMGQSVDSSLEGWSVNSGEFLWA